MNKYKVKYRERPSGQIATAWKQAESAASAIEQTLQQPFVINVLDVEEVPSTNVEVDRAEAIFKAFEGVCAWCNAQTGVVHQAGTAAWMENFNFHNEAEGLPTKTLWTRPGYEGEVTFKCENGHELVTSFSEGSGWW
jgi:hypothetical protein